MIKHRKRDLSRYDPAVFNQGDQEDEPEDVDAHVDDRCAPSLTPPQTTPNNSFL